MLVAIEGVGVLRDRLVYEMPMPTVSQGYAEQTIAKLNNVLKMVSHVGAELDHISEFLRTVPLK